MATVCEMMGIGDKAIRAEYWLWNCEEERVVRLDEKGQTEGNQCSGNLENSVDGPRDTRERWVYL